MKIGKWVTHPAADLLPLLEGEEFRALQKSIIERGLERPVLLVHDPGGEHDGKVIDGRNRLRACIAVNIEPSFEFWEGSDDPYEFVWAHNAVRRHLEPGQRAQVRLKMDEAIRAEAERKRAAANESRSAKAKGNRNAAKGEKQSRSPVTGTEDHGQTGSLDARELAGRADVSVGTAKKAIAVAKKAPELADQVAAGELNLSAAYRKVTRDEAIERIRKEPEPLPDGKYRVIVADPPWPYEVRNDDETHRAAIPYHSMTIEQICALPVGNRAQDDSILWLWTTNAFLDKAFEVGRAWGFEHKTVLTWDKGRIGAGNWLRNQTEHCILFVRGKPVVSLTNQSTVLRAAPGRHSEKPDEFYDLVEQLCPGSRLELFARRARPGWVAWGSELDGIVRDGVTAPAAQADPIVAVEPVTVSELLGAEVVDQVAEALLPDLDTDDDWGGRPAGWNLSTTTTTPAIPAGLTDDGIGDPPAEDEVDGVQLEHEERVAREAAIRESERRFQAGRARAAQPWPDRIKAHRQRMAALSRAQRKVLDALNWERLARASKHHDGRPDTLVAEHRAILAAVPQGELAVFANLLDEEEAIRDHQDEERNAADKARRAKVSKPKRRPGGRRAAR